MDNATSAKFGDIVTQVIAAIQTLNANRLTSIVTAAIATVNHIITFFNRRDEI